MGTSIQVSGGSQVMAALAHLAAATKDLHEPLDAIGQDIEEQVQLCFADSRDPYGAAWLPLKTRSGQPLLNTRKLQASITHAVEPHAVTIGTNANSGGVPYPRVHQFGAFIQAKNAPYLRFKTPNGWASKKSVTIPARPFLPTNGLPSEWSESVLDILTEHFTGAFQ